MFPRGGSLLPSLYADGRSSGDVIACCRYVLEYGVNGRARPSHRNDFQTEYTIDLKIPAGVECERCVLQMTYVTANSADGWPETFWNCADVAVVSDGMVTPAPPAPAPACKDQTKKGPCKKAGGTQGCKWSSSGCTVASIPAQTPAPTAEPAPVTPTPPAPAPAPAPAPHGDCPSPIAPWSKCNGKGWQGSTCCTQGHACDYQSTWYSQCVPNTDDPNPAPPPTPTPAANDGGGKGSDAVDAPTVQCVSHAQLVAINAESGYWPACDSAANTGKAGVAGPPGRIYGQYCTSEWADALNAMLHHLDLCGVADSEIRRRFLAQVQWETGYMSTLSQPADDGSGLIHMIPQNWQANVDDIEAVFPGEGIAAHYASLLTHDARAAFFSDPKYAYKSAAAWFKRTNRLVPGCGKDLWFAPYDEQTRCIFGSVTPGDRQVENPP